MACADFIVASNHKWLGAYVPMGIGFVASRWRGWFEQDYHARERRSQWIDSLLSFVEHLSRHRLEIHSETVNISPLFACAGAVSDRLSAANHPEGKPLSRPEQLPQFSITDAHIRQGLLQTQWPARLQPLKSGHMQ